MNQEFNLKQAMEEVCDAEFVGDAKQTVLFEGFLDGVPDRDTVNEEELQNAVDGAYERFEENLSSSSQFVNVYIDRRMALCQKAARAIFESRHEDPSKGTMPFEYVYQLKTSATNSRCIE